MADLRPCRDTEPHEAHQWTEDVPTAPLGKHFHHCHGIEADQARGNVRPEEES